MFHLQLLRSFVVWGMVISIAGLSNGLEMWMWAYNYASPDRLHFRRQRFFLKPTFFRAYSVCHCSVSWYYDYKHASTAFATGNVHLFRVLFGEPSSRHSHGIIVYVIESHDAYTFNQAVKYQNCMAAVNNEQCCFLLQCISDKKGVARFAILYAGPGLFLLIHRIKHTYNANQALCCSVRNLYSRSEVDSRRCC